MFDDDPVGRLIDLVIRILGHLTDTDLSGQTAAALHKRLGGGYIEGPVFHQVAVELLPPGPLIRVVVDGTGAPCAVHRPVETFLPDHRQDTVIAALLIDPDPLGEILACQEGAGGLDQDHLLKIHLRDEILHRGFCGRRVCGRGRIPVDEPDLFRVRKVLQVLLHTSADDLSVRTDVNLADRAAAAGGLYDPAYEGLAGDGPDVLQSDGFTPRPHRYESCVSVLCHGVPLISCILVYPAGPARWAGSRMI